MARSARERVLREHAHGKAFALELKWSEHQVNGAFVRGGVTDLVSRTTRLVSNSQDDPDIQTLARLATHESPLEGSLVAFPSGDRFAWFLPFTPTQADRLVDRKVRGLLVNEPLFAEILELMQPDRNFTHAERRVMFQVIAGLSLRDAADRDGVAFETKRAHIKSGFSKMHCANQQDLVRTVLGLLIHLLSASEGETAHAGPADTFVSRYLQDDARIDVTRLPNGRVLRVLTCGPESGRPLLMIHGMMFPITLVGVSRHLDAAQIRLIVPVRPGFLESRSPSRLSAQNDFIGEALSELALYIRATWNEPVAILGQSLGAALAIRLAGQNPELVSRLILQSVNLTKGRGTGSPAGAFYGSLKRLSREPDLFRRVNWQYYKYYADRVTGRSVLSRLFADLPIDMAVLDGKATGLEAYQMFADLYASSVFGMSADFDYVMNTERHDLGGLTQSVAFIHGADDPLTSPAELSGFLGDEDRYTRHIIPGGGHFVAASHATAVWRLIANELDRAG